MILRKYQEIFTWNIKYLFGIGIFLVGIPNSWLPIDFISVSGEHWTRVQNTYAGRNWRRRILTNFELFWRILGFEVTKFLGQVSRKNTKNDCKGWITALSLSNRVSRRPLKYTLHFFAQVSRQVRHETRAENVAFISMGEARRDLTAREL